MPYCRNCAKNISDVQDRNNKGYCNQCLQDKKVEKESQTLNQEEPSILASLICLIIIYVIVVISLIVIYPEWVLSPAGIFILVIASISSFIFLVAWINDL